MVVVSRGDHFGVCPKDPLRGFKLRDAGMASKQLAYPAVVAALITALQNSTSSLEQKMNV